MTTVSFPSRGHLLEGRWLAPRRQARTDVPCVVMAHGLGLERRAGLARYADRMAEAGFAVLAFDYAGFGASGGRPRSVVSPRAQLADWRAAVAFARSQQQVRADRIVLWGTSFSGGHVIKVAAADPAIRALVAQCPFTDGIASARAMGLRSMGRLVPHVGRDLLCAVARRPAHLVRAAGPDRGVALMVGDEVAHGYLALAGDGPPLPNVVAARSALAILGYRPGRAATQVRCPALVQLCTQDEVAPAQASARLLSRMPRAQIIQYPIGHFEIYRDQHFEWAVAAQLAFLRSVTAEG